MKLDMKKTYKYGQDVFRVIANVYPVPVKGFLYRKKLIEKWVGLPAKELDVVIANDRYSTKHIKTFEVSSGNMVTFDDIDFNEPCVLIDFPLEPLRSMEVHSRSTLFTNYQEYLKLTSYDD